MKTHTQAVFGCRFVTCHDTLNHPDTSAFCILSSNVTGWEYLIIATLTDLYIYLHQALLHVVLLHIHQNRRCASKHPQFVRHHIAFIIAIIKFQPKCKILKWGCNACYITAPLLSFHCIYMLHASSVHHSDAAWRKQTGFVVLYE